MKKGWDTHSGCRNVLVQSREAWAKPHKLKGIEGPDKILEVMKHLLETWPQMGYEIAGSAQSHCICLGGERSVGSCNKLTLNRCSQCVWNISSRELFSLIYSDKLRIFFCRNNFADLAPCYIYHKLFTLFFWLWLGKKGISGMWS